MKRIFLILLSVISLHSCKEPVSLTDDFSQKMQSVSSSELGTVECKITKVIKADHKATWYKFGDRKILFECKGSVKAGIDLSTSDSYTVTIDEENKSIDLMLPSAKILSININPEDITLAYEKVSITRSDFTSVERTELLKQGELSIREDICKNKEILVEAEKNATSFFSAMLRQMGFKQINVKFRK